MTPAMRVVLQAHLERKLGPKARIRARNLRMAMYPSWTLLDLHKEYTRILAARVFANAERNVFLHQLCDDLAAQIEGRSDQDERRTA